MKVSKNRPNVWTQYTDDYGWHSRLWYHGSPLPLWVHRVARPKRGPAFRWYVTQEPEGQLDLALVSDQGRFLFNDLFQARDLARSVAARLYT